MIYAKCIRGSQIVSTDVDFQSRQNEEYHVYCIGQTTLSKNGFDILSCVPLNFIYDCLKYGRYIAIIEEYDEDTEYPDRSSYLGFERSSSKQKVLNIIDSQSKDTIDYVFDMVGDAKMVHDGYVHTLSQDIQDYFRKKKKGLS